MSQSKTPKEKKPLGRPRLEIDLDAVATAVAELYEDQGDEGVTIAAAADRLNVSRATLYRKFPSKDHIVAVLFERSTTELSDAAKAVLEGEGTPRERLEALIKLQVDASIRMRGYLPVFFGGGGLPDEYYSRWRTFSRDYEQMWVTVVKECMEGGHLPKADPVVTARLLLGQCLWVSRWYRPRSRYSGQVILEAVLALLPPA